MLLEVKDLWVHYDRIEAVKGVSLHVDEGSTVAFVGANGAGKTTILRTISGLKSPTAGEIRFHGQRIERISDREKVTAFCAIIDNLVSGKGGSTVDACEMVHENLLAG